MIFQGFLLLLALQETIEIPNKTPQFLQFDNENCYGGPKQSFAAQNVPKPYKHSCTYTTHSELVNPTKSRLRNRLEETAMDNTLQNLEKIELLANKPTLLNGNSKHFDVLALGNPIRPHSSSNSLQSVPSTSKNIDISTTSHSCAIFSQLESTLIFNQTCNETNHVSNSAFDATNLQVSQLLNNKFVPEAKLDISENVDIKKTDFLSLGSTYKNRMSRHFENNIDDSSKSSNGKSKYHISELEIMFRIAIFLMLFVTVFLFNIYFCGSIVYCVYKKGFVPLDS